MARNSSVVAGVIRAEEGSISEHDPDTVSICIHEPIGVGGMAHVMLAHDVSLDRPVALKFLGRSLLEDAVWRERFVLEARNMARVRHPNVMPIHAFGIHQGWPYFVMDYIEGDTLAAIQRTAIGLARTIPLGISLRIVLDALAGGLVLAGETVQTLPAMDMIAGEVHVFDEAAAWARTQVLTPQDAEGGDRFGYALSGSLGRDALLALATAVHQQL